MSSNGFPHPQPTRYSFEKSPDPAYYITRDEDYRVERVARVSLYRISRTWVDLSEWNITAATYLPAVVYEAINENTERLAKAQDEFLHDMFLRMVCHYLQNPKDVTQFKNDGRPQEITCTISVGIGWNLTGFSPEKPDTRAFLFAAPRRMALAKIEAYEPTAMAIETALPAITQTMSAVYNNLPVRPVRAFGAGAAGASSPR